MDIWSLELPGGDLEAAGLLRNVTQRVHDEIVRLVGVEAADKACTDSGYYSPYLSIPWPSLGTVWLVPRGEYAGTFPKRLRKWLNVVRPREIAGSWKPWADLQIKFPDSFFAQLGADLGPIVNSGIVYRCDLVHRITWEAGDFGDEGSCYWKSDSYLHARGSLEAETGRFFALRFFDNEGNGYARCWGLRCEGGVALFNAYGAPLITCARVLSHITGMSYAPCSFRYDDNVIFVNNRSHHGNAYDRGIALYSSDTAPGRLDLDVDYVRDDDCHCSGCQDAGNTCDDCGADEDNCECYTCEICEERNCGSCCRACAHTRGDCVCCAECSLPPYEHRQSSRAPYCQCFTCPLCSDRFDDCYCFDVIERANGLSRYQWERAITYLEEGSLAIAWALFARDLDLVMGQLRFTFLGGSSYADAA